MTITMHPATRAIIDAFQSPTTQQYKPFATVQARAKAADMRRGGATMDAIADHFDVTVPTIYAMFKSYNYNFAPPPPKIVTPERINAIAEMRMHGHTGDEIASRLGISIKAVEAIVREHKLPLRRRLRADAVATNVARTPAGHINWQSERDAIISFRAQRKSRDWLRGYYGVSGGTIDDVIRDLDVPRSTHQAQPGVIAKRERVKAELREMGAVSERMVAKRRTCLLCVAEGVANPSFLSSHAGNRLCGRCRKHVGGME